MKLETLKLANQLYEDSQKLLDVMIKDSMKKQSEKVFSEEEFILIDKLHTKLFNKIMEL